MFGILGELCSVGDPPTPLPSAPKTRQLLALLLANANRSVSVATCVEELWGDDIPRTAIQSVQTRICEVRQYLARSDRVGSHEQAKGMVQTGPNGYTISLEPGRTDLDRVHALAEDGESARAADDAVAASRAFRAALAMWRGPVLSDITPGPHLEPWVASTSAYRMSLWEQCIEVELRLGRHHGLLSELEGLVRHHPFHENFHAQYIVALYRSGRRVQALECYQSLRRSMCDDFGIEPSIQMRRIQTAILSDDPVLAVPSPRETKLSLEMY